LGLPVIQPERLKNDDVIQQLSAFHPEVIVVAAFGQFLPPPVLAVPPHGCVNIHPSLLPKFRGPSPVTAVILAGEKFAGVSIMLMDAGLDTGPVLAQGQAAISRQDTTGTLTEKLALVGAHMLVETLPRWVRGDITPLRQEETLSTYSKMMVKEDGEIDWSKPAGEIWLKVRALQPWPGCYTRWRGKQIKIIEALPLPPVETAQAGYVVALNHEKVRFGVAAGGGVLGIVRVQMEGKKAMSSAEFLRGQAGLVGAVLPS